MAVDTERYSSFTFGAVDYTVSMSVQNSSQLSVQVEERSSADQWHNTFDANCKFSTVQLHMSLQLSAMTIFKIKIEVIFFIESNRNQINDSG